MEELERQDDEAEVDRLALRLAEPALAAQRLERIAAGSPARASWRHHTSGSAPASRPDARRELPVRLPHAEDALHVVVGLVLAEHLLAQRVAALRAHLGGVLGECVGPGVVGGEGALEVAVEALSRRAGSARRSAG